jgi:hypothetical protein
LTLIGNKCAALALFLALAAPVQAQTTGEGSGSFPFKLERRPIAIVLVSDSWPFRSPANAVVELRGNTTTLFINAERDSTDAVIDRGLRFAADLQGSGLKTGGKIIPVFGGPMWGPEREAVSQVPAHVVRQGWRQARPTVYPGRGTWRLYQTKLNVLVPKAD